MDKISYLLIVLFVIALFALPILLLSGVITTTFLWYLAWSSLALGLTIYVLGVIFVKILEKDGCDECGVVFVVFIPPALFCVLLGILSLLIILFTGSDIVTTMITWLIIATFIIGIIWSTFSILASIMKRR